MDKPVTGQTMKKRKIKKKEYRNEYLVAMNEVALH